MDCRLSLRKALQGAAAFSRPIMSQHIQFVVPHDAKRPPGRYHGRNGAKNRPRIAASINKVPDKNGPVIWMAPDPSDGRVTKGSEKVIQRIGVPMHVTDDVETVRI